MPTKVSLHISICQGKTWKNVFLIPVNFCQFQIELHFYTACELLSYQLLVIVSVTEGGCSSTCTRAEVLTKLSMHAT